MSNHDSAFLEAIVAEPDDDTPRLIYADWLDAQGDPRGEFIRAQCESAGYVANYDAESMQCKQMDARADTLLRKYRADWEASLQAAFKEVKNYHVRGIFRRGMLEGIEVLYGKPKTETWEIDKPSQTAGSKRFPMGNFLERFSEFLDTPEGSAVNALYFGRSDGLITVSTPILTNDMLGLMANCESLRRIKELGLNCQDHIDTQGIAALSAEDSSLHELESLQMYLTLWADSSNREAAILTEDQIRSNGWVLARFKHLKSLTILNEIHHGLLQGLLEKSPPPLETLHINASLLYEQSTQLLADSPIKNTLRKLYVENAQSVNTENPIRHDLCAILPQFTQLESLTFDKIYTLNRDSMKALSQCANLQALTIKKPEFFNVDRSQKPPHRCGVLFAPDSRLTKLKLLNIDTGRFLPTVAGVPFWDDDIIALASPDCPLKNLQYLTLKRCRLNGREEVLSDFMRSPVAGNLELLDLSGNMLQNAPLHALARRRTPTALQQLDYGLNYHACRDALSWLSHSPALPNLKSLTVPIKDHEQDASKEHLFVTLATRRGQILSGWQLEGGLPELNEVNFIAEATGSDQLDNNISYKPYLTFSPMDHKRVPEGKDVSAALKKCHEAEEKKAKEAEAAAKGEQAPAEEKSPTSEVSSSQVYYYNLRRRRGEQ